MRLSPELLQLTISETIIRKRFKNYTKNMIYQTLRDQNVRSYSDFNIFKALKFKKKHGKLISPKR